MNKAVCLVCFLVFPVAAGGADGVGGNTIRPMLDDAKVPGCKIAKPGSYDVKVGDLVELEYTYPIRPNAPPKDVGFKQPVQTDGSLKPSPLGIRSVVTPKLVGAGRIAFYFEGATEGETSVTLLIDNDEYVYKFKVSKPEKK